MGLECTRNAENGMKRLVADCGVVDQVLARNPLSRMEKKLLTEMRVCCGGALSKASGDQADQSEGVEKERPSPHTRK